MSKVPCSTTLLCALGLLAVAACGDEPLSSPRPALAWAGAGAPASGREIFRHETWGDEAFWTTPLRLHEVVQTAVDPVTALTVGLKVDATQLPPGFLAGADLRSPATTVELLRRDAGGGLKAQVTAAGGVAPLGVTCALWPPTVDNSVAPGVGPRLGGRAERHLK